MKKKHSLFTYFLLVSLLSSVASSSDALLKLRAKQLSKKNKNVSYTKIRTKKELEAYQKTGGVRIKKGNKSRNIINYVEIENTKIYDRGNVQRGSFQRGYTNFKNSRSSDTNYNKNIGIVVEKDAKLKGRVSNVVKVKNSTINTSAQDNLNIGIAVKGTNVNGVNIKNRVYVDRSTLGGR
jgi:hypothetical protein